MIRLTCDPGLIDDIRSPCMEMPDMPHASALSKVTGALRLTSYQSFFRDITCRLRSTIFCTRASTTARSAATSFSRWSALL